MAPICRNNPSMSPWCHIATTFPLPAHSSSHSSTKNDRLCEFVSLYLCAIRPFESSGDQNIPLQPPLSSAEVGLLVRDKVIQTIQYPCPNSSSHPLFDWPNHRRVFPSYCQKDRGNRNCHPPIRSFSIQIHGNSVVWRPSGHIGLWRLRRRHIATQAQRHITGIELSPLPLLLVERELQTQEILIELHRSFQVAHQE